MPEDLIKSNEGASLTICLSSIIVHEAILKCVVTTRLKHLISPVIAGNLLCGDNVCACFRKQRALATSI